MTLLLKNATAVVLDPPSVTKTDIRISGGYIAERGKDLQRRNQEEVVDLKNKFVMPGFVCAHTHLYSSLSRGMPSPGRPPKSFEGILREIWWKLDRALDGDSIYYSALAGAIEAVRCGTTTIIDHHASPEAIPGSLNHIRDALRKVGLRGVLCYEVTDRGGIKQRDLGLLENEQFIEAHRGDDAFRGFVGAHASFTLSDKSLRACGELAAATGTGVHIHVAEDQADVLDARKKFGAGVIDRLNKAGVLAPSSILAHCVHLRKQEIRQVEHSGAWVVHNPRSNMNNNVGHAPIHLFGKRTALGTDGFPADMIEEARCGFFRNRETAGRNEGDRIIKFLQSGQDLASVIFGKKFGTLAAGSVADLLVLDYIPPTPLTSQNLPFHFLFGWRSSLVESVMVGGKWVLWRRELVGIDEELALRKAAGAAAGLWKKISKTRT